MKNKEFNKNDFGIIGLSILLVYIVTIVNNLIVATEFSFFTEIILQDFQFYFIPFIEIISFMFISLFLVSLFGISIKKGKGFFKNAIFLSAIFGLITALLRFITFSFSVSNYFIFFSIFLFRSITLFGSLFLSKLILRRR